MNADNERRPGRCERLNSKSKPKCVNGPASAYGNAFTKRPTATTDFFPTAASRWCIGGHGRCNGGRWRESLRWRGSTGMRPMRPLALHNLLEFKSQSTISRPPGQPFFMKTTAVSRRSIGSSGGLSPQSRLVGLNARLPALPTRIRLRGQVL